jgi:iron complex outermembrane recepter protein
MIRSWMVVALVLAATMGSAVAKSESPPKVEARRHYDAGMAHFNLREYELAIEEFQAGYRLRPDPVFLYNVAQAYRLLEDSRQALYFYRAYLRNSPEAANRQEVEERIAIIEKVQQERQLAAAAAPAPAPAATAVRDAAPPAPVTASASKPSLRQDLKTPVYRRWWFWTVIGVGAAGAAVGIGLGVKASRSPAFDANLGTVGPASLAVKF